MGDVVRVDFRSRGRRIAAGRRQKAVTLDPLPLVDPGAYLPPLSRRGTRAELRVGFLGRIHPKQNLGVLIDALTRLPEHVRLAVVGDGPSSSEVRDFVTVDIDLDEVWDVARGRLRIVIESYMAMRPVALGGDETACSHRRRFELRVGHKTGFHQGKSRRFALKRHDCAPTELGQDQSVVAEVAADIEAFGSQVDTAP